MVVNSCAVIPVYNHPRCIEALLQQLAGFGLHCIIVNDGSNTSCSKLLTGLAENNAALSLVEHSENRGKGAAVMTGLLAAEAQGFTHALQIDADGQHDVADVGKFLALAEQQPTAMICGQPCFDVSIPRGRLIARKITHFWVCVETLSRQVIDTMCGFRVYPLTSVCPLLREERLGERMDFDIEVLVRLLWRGLAIETLQTKVSYPEEGSSHFRYLQDNVLISWMHTKLVFGMLRRSPRLLARKFSAGNRHWSQVGERGAVTGLKLLLKAYRLFGRRVFNSLLYPVIFYFVLSNHQARNASREYLAQLAMYRAGKTAADDSRVFEDFRRAVRWRDIYHHFFSFGDAAIDKIASWSGDLGRENIHFEGREQFLELLNAGRGGIIVGSHLGNIELSRAFVSEGYKDKINALMFTGHSAGFTAVLEQVNDKILEGVISVSHVGPETAILIQSKIDNGESMIVLGDRTGISSEGRINRVNFLGREAPFGQGPFILAALLKCPVYLMFCIKEEGGYRVYFEPFSEQIICWRKHRQEDLQPVLQQYGDRLAYYCQQAPLQWFNFYNYWEQDTTPVTSKKQRELKLTAESR